MKITFNSLQAAVTNENNYSEKTDEANPLIVESHESDKGGVERFSLIDGTYHKSDKTFKHQNGQLTTGTIYDNDGVISEKDDSTSTIKEVSGMKQNSNITMIKGGFDYQDENTDNQGTLLNPNWDTISKVLKHQAISALNVDGIASLISEAISPSTTTDTDGFSYEEANAEIIKWKEKNYKQIHTDDFKDSQYFNSAANITNSAKDDLRGSLASYSGLDSSQSVGNQIKGFVTNKVGDILDDFEGWGETAEEIANLNLASEATMYWSKPGISIKSKNNVPMTIKNSDLSTSEFLETKLGKTGEYIKPLASLHIIGNTTSTNNMELSDAQARAITMIKNNRSYNARCGSIHVKPYYTEDTFNSFNIPFEFTPQITEGSIQANYQSEQLLGRIGDYKSYTGTQLPTLTITAVYMALSPDEFTPDDMAKEYNTNSWQAYWTNKRIAAIENQYRSLVYGDVTSDREYLTKPPIIQIKMNRKGEVDSNGTFIDLSDDISSYAIQDMEDIYTYPAWTRSTEAGSTEAGSKYLQISGVDLYKKYIVTSVTISSLDNGYNFKIPSLYERTDVITDGTEGDGVGSYIKVADSESRGNTYKRGFKVELNCQEITENFLDIVPDFRCYYNSQKELNSDANIVSEAANTQAGNNFDVQNLQNELIESASELSLNLGTLEEKIKTLIRRAYKTGANISDATKANFKSICNAYSELYTLNNLQPLSCYCNNQYFRNDLTYKSGDTDFDGRNNCFKQISLSNYANDYYFFNVNSSKDGFKLEKNEKAVFPGILDITPSNDKLAFTTYKTEKTFTFSTKHNATDSLKDFGLNITVKDLFGNAIISSDNKLTGFKHPENITYDNNKYEIDETNSDEFFNTDTDNFVAKKIINSSSPSQDFNKRLRAHKYIYSNDNGEIMIYAVANGDFDKDIAQNSAAPSNINYNKENFSVYFLIKTINTRTKKTDGNFYPYKLAVISSPRIIQRNSSGYISQGYLYSSGDLKEENIKFDYYCETDAESKDSVEKTYTKTYEVYFEVYKDYINSFNADENKFKSNFINEINLRDFKASDTCLTSAVSPSTATTLYNMVFYKTCIENLQEINIIGINSEDIKLFEHLDTYYKILKTAVNKESNFANLTKYMNKNAEIDYAQTYLKIWKLLKDNLSNNIVGSFYKLYSRAREGKENNYKDFDYTTFETDYKKFKEIEAGDTSENNTIGRLLEYINNTDLKDILEKIENKEIKITGQNLSKEATNFKSLCSSLISDFAIGGNPEHLGTTSTIYFKYTVLLKNIDDDINIIKTNSGTSSSTSNKKPPTEKAALAINSVLSALKDQTLTNGTLYGFDIDSDGNLTTTTLTDKYPTIDGYLKAFNNSMAESIVLSKKVYTEAKTFFVPVTCLPQIKSATLSYDGSYWTFEAEVLEKYKSSILESDEIGDYKQYYSKSQGKIVAKSTSLVDEGDSEGIFNIMYVFLSSGIWYLNETSGEVKAIISASLVTSEEIDYEEITVSSLKEYNDRLTNLSEKIDNILSSDTEDKVGASLLGGAFINPRNCNTLADDLEDATENLDKSKTKLQEAAHNLTKYYNIKNSDWSYTEIKKDEELKDEEKEEKKNFKDAYDTALSEFKKAKTKLEEAKASFNNSDDITVPPLAYYNLNLCSEENLTKYYNTLMLSYKNTSSSSSAPYSTVSSSEPTESYKNFSDNIIVNGTAKMDEDQFVAYVYYGENSYLLGETPSDKEKFISGITSSDALKATDTDTDKLFDNSYNICKLQNDYCGYQEATT